MSPYFNTWKGYAKDPHKKCAWVYIKSINEYSHKEECHRQETAITIVIQLLKPSWSLCCGNQHKDIHLCSYTKERCCAESTQELARCMSDWDDRTCQWHTLRDQIYQTSFATPLSLLRLSCGASYARRALTIQHQEWVALALWLSWVAISAMWDRCADCPWLPGVWFGPAGETRSQPKDCDKICFLEVFFINIIKKKTWQRILPYLKVQWVKFGLIYDFLHW